MKQEPNNLPTVKLEYFMFLKSFGERNYTDTEFVIRAFRKEFGIKDEHARRLHVSYLHMVSEATNPLKDRSLSEDDLALVPLSESMPKFVQEIEREYVHPIRKETLLCGKIVFTYPSRV
jgi:hypothetical protein